MPHPALVRPSPQPHPPPPSLGVAALESFCSPPRHDKKQERERAISHLSKGIPSFTSTTLRSCGSRSSSSDSAESWSSDEVVTPTSSPTSFREMTSLPAISPLPDQDLQPANCHVKIHINDSLIAERSWSHLIPYIHPFHDEISPAVSSHFSLKVR